MLMVAKVTNVYCTVCHWSRNILNGQSVPSKCPACGDGAARQWGHQDPKINQPIGRL